MGDSGAKGMYVHETWLLCGSPRRRHARNRGSLSQFFEVGSQNLACGLGMGIRGYPVIERRKLDILVSSSALWCASSTNN